MDRIRYLFGLFRHYLGLAVIVAIIWAAVILLPKLARAKVPLGYADMNGMIEYTSYPLDTTIPFERLAYGDVVSFRLGGDEDRATYFARIAGVQGDRVELNAQGHFTVNGEDFTHGDVVQSPTIGSITVPVDHLFLISDSHQFDSVVHGPIPRYALNGRVEFTR